MDKLGLKRNSSPHMFLVLTFPFFCNTEILVATAKFLDKINFFPNKISFKKNLDEFCSCRYLLPAYRLCYLAITKVHVLPFSVSIHMHLSLEIDRSFFLQAAF